jgi:hypothetical protein
MSGRGSGRLFQIVFAAALLLMTVVPAFTAIKKWAVIAPANSKLEGVSLANMVQLCKGTPKSWPDGKAFTLVMHSPEDPEMRSAVQALFGVAPVDMKNFLANVNQSRVVIKIVDSDEDLLRTVVATPGAVGLVDVYAINSSVKVLRIDGKLPFDAGYAFKGN